jgi:hypothetical protein
MPGFHTGAQGPSAAVGAQGPQAYFSSRFGAQGSQPPTAFNGPQGLWGSQGPIANKPSAFLNYPRSTNLDIVSARLEVHYTLRCGSKFAILVDRTISTQDDILNKFPDDLVQMANLMDFRPRAGFYTTSAPILLWS